MLSEMLAGSPCPASASSAGTPPATAASRSAHALFDRHRVRLARRARTGPGPWHPAPGATCTSATTRLFGVSGVRVRLERKSSTGTRNSTKPFFCHSLSFLVWVAACMTTLLGRAEARKIPPKPTARKGGSLRSRLFTAAKCRSNTHDAHDVRLAFRPHRYGAAGTSAAQGIAKRQPTEKKRGDAVIKVASPDRADHSPTSIP